MLHSTEQVLSSRRACGWPPEDNLEAQRGDRLLRDSVCVGLRPSGAVGPTKSALAMGSVGNLCFGSGSGVVVLDWAQLSSDQGRRMRT